MINLKDRHALITGGLGTIGIGGDWQTTVPTRFKTIKEVQPWT